MQRKSLAKKEKGEEKEDEDGSERARALDRIEVPVVTLKVIVERGRRHSRGSRLSFILARVRPNRFSSHTQTKKKTKKKGRRNVLRNSINNAYARFACCRLHISRVHRILSMNGEPKSVKTNTFASRVLQRFCCFRL